MKKVRQQPYLELNNGIRMPALGLGVFQSSADETVTAVRRALEIGYRLIDTAAAYGNEKQVGEAIRNSGVNRNDIFVTTKLWISNYGYEQTLRAFEKSLNKLGLEYLDLYLLHWPVPKDFDNTVASYKAAQQLLADGKVRAIGVCNHNPDHLAKLIDRTEIIPAVNQVELNPYFTQAEVRAANSGYGIITQSWSPIGGVNVYWASDPGTARNPLKDRVITELAEHYGRTPAQIILRWHLEHGFSAIPKSVQTGRIAENFDLFDFELSPEDVILIDGLHTGQRGGPDPSIFDLSKTKLRIDN